MMGGATEHDEAMRWFLQRADGGDILVLRTSGTDGYNDYFYSDLGVDIHSVETLVFHDASAAYDPYIQQRIMEAEAIWFAGGDQWEYISYWRDTPIDSLINLGLQARTLPIGGTSAGMAILGGYYFSAENGTVTSTEALSDPYNTYMTVDTLPFLRIPYLENVITDTHYDNPDRKGRHLTFLARIYQDYGYIAKGIACDEYTAICMEPNGFARVFGEAPTYDDNAYFIQPNCALPDVAPESCSPGLPLHWNLNQESIKVYKVQGTPTGDHTFTINDWEQQSGGEWQTWYIDNGVLFEGPSDSVSCILPLSFPQSIPYTVSIAPNPASTHTHINVPKGWIEGISLFTLTGKRLEYWHIPPTRSFDLSIEALPKGLYILHIQTDRGMLSQKLQKY